MSKKNVYSILLILFIFVFSFGIVYLFAFSKKADNYSKLNIVKDYSVYFSAVENVNSFINALKESNSEKLYGLLSNDYIKKHRIKKNNILKKFNIIEKNVVFSGDKIYYLDNDNKYLFLVTGSLINEESQKVVDDNYKIALIVDYNNFIVAFYPLKKVENIDNIVDINLKKNVYNSFKSSKSLSDQSICKLYYEKFIYYVNNDIDGLYEIVINDIKNDYLFSDFNSIISKKFYNYKYNFSSCKVDYNEDNGNRVFNLIDKKNNNIVFYEDGVMKFKIKINLV